MERSENVNAAPRGDEGDEMEVFADAQARVSEPVLAAASEQGPCLYLGPAGQRCERRALEGGFCARHQPGGGVRLSATQLTRRTVGIVGVLAVLWPLLADLIREIIRLLR